MVCHKIITLYFYDYSIPQYFTLENKLLWSWWWNTENVVCLFEVQILKCLWGSAPDFGSHTFWYLHPQKAALPVEDIYASGPSTTTIQAVFQSSTTLKSRIPSVCMWCTLSFTLWNFIYFHLKGNLKPNIAFMNKNNIVLPWR